MNNSPGYYAIIPAHVRYCKSLEMGARLLYGEITALGNAHGYCWATNKYFSDLYEVDERTIKRWIKSLSDQKFIKITTNKEGIQWQRQLWISHEIEKMFTKGQKCPGGGTKMSWGGDKNVLHNNTTNNTSKKNPLNPPKGESPPRKASSSRKVSFDREKKTFNNISQEDIDDWRRLYPAVNVLQIIDEARVWAKDHHRENYRKSILTFLKNRNENNTTPYTPKPEMVAKKASEIEIKANRDTAMKWEKRIPQAARSHYSINASHDSVQFVMPNNQGYSVSYDDEKFMKLCEKAIKRMKIE